MTIKELIENLKQYPDDYKVVVYVAELRSFDADIFGVDNGGRTVLIGASGEGVEA